MNIQELCGTILEMYRPPSDANVSDWADHHRVLVGKAAAEPGPWRTERAPYQREIMNAFTDPEVWKIVMMTSSQVGKTDMTINMIGRSIDLNPGPMLLVGPSDAYMESFSKERLADTIAASPALRKKVYEAKSRSSGNTILMKSFPGGFLSMTGANSPAGLAGRPIRDLFMDEVDRFPRSAGTEGDPVRLAEKRTQTFFNRRVVLTSSPTIRGDSRIEREFIHGTQEEWCIQCKNCQGFFPIKFDDIRFEKEQIGEGAHREYDVLDVWWRCPSCNGRMTETEVKKAPAMWIPYNPRAKKNGVRSFHLNAFVSPWGKWKDLVKSFLDAMDDVEMLKTFYNTTLGESFAYRESRGVPDALYERREKYKAEVPRGVLVLTMGIDVQDNRLEYEVVGWGRSEESWGIQRGVIPGRADDPTTWQPVDELLDRAWELENGKALRIAVTFVDSGGHFTEEVYDACRRRLARRVYPIKGDNKEEGPYVRLAKTQKSTKHGLNLFILNVSAGKEAIMYASGVDKPGPRYMHYPDNEEAGYDEEYFRGLISETRVYSKSKHKMIWEKIYERNEPLDMRNYARAAFKGFTIDLAAAEERLYGETRITRAPPPDAPRKKKGVISGGIRL